MPIYEYTCQKCCKEFEELVLKADDIPTCPFCACTETKRLISVSKHSSGKGSDIGSATSASSSKRSCGGCKGGSCSSCG